jgi:hypothetical protein
MTRPKKRKRPQGSDAPNVIDTIQKAASTAMKIYKTVEPILKAIRTLRGKTK